MLDYHRGRGPLYKIHPITKLTWAACLSIMAFVLPEIWMVWAVFLVPLSLVLFSGLVRRVYKPALIVLVPFGVSLFIIHGLFNPDNEHVLFSVGPVVFWKEGVDFGALILGRVATTLFSFMALLFSTSPRDIMTGLSMRGGSPKVGYVMLAAIEFIPDMQRRAQSVIAAQQSRGLDMGGNVIRRTLSFVALMGPLVGGAMIMADTRAMALEARAFSRKGPQTYLNVMPESWRSYSAQIVAVALLVAVIVLRIVL